MRPRLISICIALLFVVFQFSGITSAFADDSSHVDNQVLIKIHSKKHIGRLKRLARRLRVTNIEPLFVKTASYEQQRQHVMRQFSTTKRGKEAEFFINQLQELHKLKQRKRKRKTRLDRTIAPPKMGLSYILTFPRPINVKAYSRALKNLRWVKTATPNYRMFSAGTPPRLSNDSFIDNDRNNKFDPSFLDRQGEGRPAVWGLERIRANQALAHGRGKGVVVAVLDDGIDPQFPDLVNNIYLNTAEIPGNGKDDDNNGFIDDYRGYNILADSLARQAGTWRKSDANIYSKPGPFPLEIHGNAVATVIAATANNRFGAAGVAPDAKILPVRIINANGESSLAVLARGIRYATDRGADIINMSLGGTLDKNSQGVVEVLADAINYARSKGVILFAAAGNSGESGESTYPAAHPDVISVGATNYRGEHSYFSNFGNSVDISAPGSNILVGVPALGVFGQSPVDLDYSLYTTAKAQQRLYTELSGTSFSSPMAAGVAALILSVKPAATSLEVKAAMQKTAKPIILPRGISIASGEIDALNAILEFVDESANAVQPCTNTSFRQDVKKDGFVTAIDALTVINWINGSASNREASLAAGNCTDVNADGYVTSIDVLSVINHINAQRNQ